MKILSQKLQLTIKFIVKVTLITVKIKLVSSNYLVSKTVVVLIKTFLCLFLVGNIVISSISPNRNLCNENLANFVESKICKS